VGAGSAWRFLRGLFLDGTVPDPARRTPRYVGRDASAAPATGSHKLHVIEQEAIVREAVQV
jgi:2-oxoglutarate dehydrogenase complex dehydrogenase (E1) component-like enzyme